MFKRSAILVLIISLSSAYAFGQVDPPKLDPTPDTEKQAALINEGVALHDLRNYDAAISKYEEVLKENPNSVEALYEMSFSYSMKKDYRKSMEVASRGAKYKSRLLPALYLQIGNNLDQLGEPKKAIEVYKAAIKIQPRMGIIYYNLAVTYRCLSKLDDARKAVKQAVALQPDHPSSHLFLSTLWYQGGYRTPALLAACRFLVLEPASQRTHTALKIGQEVMGGGVTAGKDPNQINILVDTSAKKDEGDFASIDLVLGLTKAAGMTEQNKNKTAMQYYTNQSSGNEEVAKWLTSNKGKVAAFLAWSRGYRWPNLD